MTYQGPQSFEPQARPSGWGALVRMITEPAATVAAFEGRVPIFPPYLVQMLLGLIGFAMAAPSTLKLLEQTYAANPAFSPSMIPTMKWAAMIFAAALLLASPWITGLFVSLIALFYGQFQEERVSFPAYLGMIGYARLPLALAGLLSGLLAMTLGIKVQAFSLSLAVLAPAGTSPVLKAFLSTLNPFDVWYYILLAIGFGTLHKGKAARGIGLAVTLFVISTLYLMGMAALGSRTAPTAF